MSTECDTVFCFIYDDTLSFDRNYHIWKSLNEKERLAYSLDLYTDDVSSVSYTHLTLPTKDSV